MGNYYIIFYMFVSLLIFFILFKLIDSIHSNDSKYDKVKYENTDKVATINDISNNINYYKYYENVYYKFKRLKYRIRIYDNYGKLKKRI